MIEYASSSICRRIERLKFGCRLYSTSIYSYAFFSYISDEKEAEEIALQIRKIIEEPITYKHTNYEAYYKQIVITANNHLKSAIDVNAMIGWLEKRFGDDFEYEYIIPTEKDYEDFEIYNEVEQAVLNIRADGNFDDERILCYVQPIHCLKTKTFRTGEALMRLQLNGRMIPPDVFIYVAEANNCIHHLTLVMLHKVCKKIKELEELNYDFDAITVNCSTLELADKEFHYEVLDIIRNNQINPSHIRLEITESTTIKNYNNILFNMKELNAHGISFYLDDFGTGYSNLERIVSYPFKTIKFDKSILYSALESEKADALIKMQVAFFEQNGFNTVVEGVKDELQYEYCKKVGFDYIQGFLFSKPVPIETITDYFEKKSVDSKN